RPLLRQAFQTGSLQEQTARCCTCSSPRLPIEYLLWSENSLSIARMHPPPPCNALPAAELLPTEPGWTDGLGGPGRRVPEPGRNEIRHVTRRGPWPGLRPWRGTSRLRHGRLTHWPCLRPLEGPAPPRSDGPG